MTILYNIYLIGILLSIVWWMFLAYFVFNKKYDENSDQSLVKSIYDLQTTLQEAFPDKNLSLQTTYLLLSLVVTFAWPVFVLLLINKKIFKKQQ